MVFSLTGLGWQCFNNPGMGRMVFGTRLRPPAFRRPVARRYVYGVNHRARVLCLPGCGVDAATL